MKAFLVLSLLLVSSLSHAKSQSCSGHLEAQFIAEVSNLTFSPAEAGNIEHTEFMLKNFHLFNENALCPLDIDLAARAVISIQGTSQLSEGQQISGVLVYNPQTNSFYIQ